MNETPLEVLDFVFNNDRTFQFKIKVWRLGGISGSKVYTTSVLSLEHHEVASKVELSLGTNIRPEDLRKLANELESAMIRAEAKLAQGEN